MQSVNPVVVHLLAMDWVEIVASIVRIIVVLNSISDWRAMFIVEFNVSGYFLVVELMLLVFLRCYVST